MAGGPPIGAGLGAALADLFAKATVQARAASAPGEAAIKDRATLSFMERGEAELRPVMEAMFDGLRNMEDVPPELKAALDRVTEPTAQFDFILQIFVFVGFVMGGFAQLSTPILSGMLGTLWSQNAFVPLSPELSATAVNRSVTSFQQGAAEAKLNGVNAARFLQMVDLAGQSLGTQELLAAFRRGIIDSARLQRGVAQSNVRTEWTDVITALRFSPMSVGAAIEAAVQGHLSIEAARVIAQQNGLLPEHFQPILETAGNPPGNETALQMVNRGIMSAGEAEQVMRESNLKNKYIPAMLEARFTELSREQITMAVQRGVMTQPEGISKLQRLGYRPADAATTVQEALARKTEVDRELAKSEVLNLYADRSIDAGKATGLLQKLGYDTQEAGLLIGLVDGVRERRFREAAISRVRSRYAAYKLSKAEASTLMDTAGIPAAQRNDLLTLWDIEREANTPILTVAQQQGLLKRGVITDAEFLQRMAQYGYAPDDAESLLFLAAPVSSF